MSVKVDHRFASDSYIFLINPYISSIERYGKEVGDIGGHQMPLGIYYLAAYLLQQGEGVEIIDAESLLLDHGKVVQILKKTSVKIIGITATTVAFRNALALAELLRRELPNVTTVIGGPHMTAMAELTMQSGAFDFGIVREGEIAFAKLVRFLLYNEGTIEEIPNLYCRNSDIISRGTSVEFVPDIDILPFPARQLCPDISLYKPPTGAYRKLPVISMITSRGCPYECIFCDNNTFGRVTRFHSAEYIVAEIKDVVQRYSVKEIAFLDDTFVLDKKRLYKMFQLLKDAQICLAWSCMTRVNNIDFELLKFMRDNGCWQIRFGIESGSQDVLDFIKKGITLEQVRNVARWCRKLNICASGFFMIGHHIDTPNTIQETIELALSLPLTDVIVTVNTPIPGTESYNRAKEFGTYDESDWSSLNYWTPVFVPNGLTREIILEKQAELYRRFYCRPSVLLLQIRKIKSFILLLKQIRNAVLGIRFIKKV